MPIEPIDTIDWYLHREAEEGTLSLTKNCRDQLLDIANDQFYMMQHPGSQTEYDQQIRKLDSTELEEMLGQALEMENEIKEKSGDLDSLEKSLHLCEKIENFNRLLGDIHREKMRLGHTVEEIVASSLWPDQVKLEPKFSIEWPLQIDNASALQSLLKNVKDIRIDVTKVYDPLKLDQVKDSIAALLRYMLKGSIPEEIKVELAKILAQKYGYLVCTFIQLFNFHDEKARFEIAKKGVGENPHAVCHYIQNFALNEDHRFEIAKLIAATNGRNTTANIKLFNILDKNKLFEIARISASESGDGTLAHLEDYELDKDRYLEIAKLCFYEALRNCTSIERMNIFSGVCEREIVSENFPSARPFFKWIEQAGLVFIPSEIETPADREKFKNLTKKALDDLFQMAEKELGLKSSQLKQLEETMASLDIEQQQKFGICLAMIFVCGAVDPSALSLIEDKNAIALVHTFAKNNNPFMLYCSTGVLLSLYEKGNETRKELWKSSPIEALTQNQIMARFCFTFIDCDQETYLTLIKKPFFNAEIMAEILILLAREKNLSPIEKGEFIKQFFFKIEGEPEKQISLINAARNLLYFESGHLLKQADPEKVLENWKIVRAQKYPFPSDITLIALCEKFPFETDKESAKKRLLDYAGQLNSMNLLLSDWMEKIPLPHEILIELVKIFASKSGTAATIKIKNYPIRNQTELFEIAKNAAKNDGANAVKFMHIYGISDKNRRKEIAWLCFINAIEKEISLTEFLKEPFISENIDSSLMDCVAKTLNLNVPLDFNNPDEKEMYKLQIAQSVEDLIGLAEKELKLHRKQLDWIKDIIEKLEPQQQQKRAAWLNIILARCMINPELLALFFQNEALGTLQTISRYNETVLLNGATEALISLYKEGNPQKMQEIGKFYKQDLPKHLIVTNLFLTFFECDRKALLNRMSPRAYINSEVMNPINEMLLMLSQETNLSPAEKTSFLARVFPPEEDRAKQKECVISARDLLFFGEGSLLKDAVPENLVGIWQSTCKKIFGISKNLDVFSKLFRLSERYPGALFTYAARLHTLPIEEREPMIEMLGKYAAAVVDGTYPAIRYDLSGNEHLQTIFDGQKGLLDKWKSSFAIDATVILAKAEESAKAEEPRELVKRLLRQSIFDNHLGPEQSAEYPTLCSLKDWSGASIDKALQEVSLKATSKENMQVEVAILKLLEAGLNANVVKQRLDELYNKLFKFKKDTQFTKDVKDLKGMLEPSKAFRDGWTVHDSDQWEDMLLMGTEVPNSCQKINGEANYNKCLLAYIHDGKNKIIVVKDRQGKIAARAVIRLLWDEKQKQPVLFMERAYAQNAPELKTLLLEGCKRKAMDLGVSLVASTRDYTDISKLPKYPFPLKSYGGPSPYEYVDALGGIQAKGIFTIDNCRIVLPMNLVQEAG